MPRTNSLQNLSAWYRRNRRELPWRHSGDPYHIWVAEVMLQQTTVRSMTPYYEAFLRRFPSIGALAAASEDEVVSAWSGLGYYHRARNLLRGARHVVERHRGRFPDDLDHALAVPGVGLYTASAVLSIAFNRPLAVVDGNVRRVLARIHALRGRSKRKESNYHRMAVEILDRRNPGEWNQALMELGALICTPRNPACPACPVRTACAARRLGLTAVIPETRPRRATADVYVKAAVIERSGRLLLVRGAETPLQRLWCVPHTSLDSTVAPNLAEELRKRYGMAIEPGPLLLRTRHRVTFRRIRLEAHAARLHSNPDSTAHDLLWAAPEEIDDLPASSMTRKIIKAWLARQLALDL
ncbi:MAG: A/G-specific adenine glycosylase [Vicinamibacteria bacterium]|nr:A/G-specific adenine glycosylase [Vicinamibacteria bacterium]